MTVTPIWYIIEVTADHFGVPVPILVGHLRTRRAVEARHVAMYLARAHTSLSFPEIARAFSGRHHTTVMHAVNKISDVVIETAYSDRRDMNSAVATERLAAHIAQIEATMTLSAASA